MSLSTDVKTHAIVTFTKSHHLITQKQFDVISNLGANQQFLIDGNLIKSNNVAEILDIKKYYETYPDRQTTSAHQPYTHTNWLELPATTDEIKTFDNYQALLRGLMKAQAKHNGRNVQALIGKTKQIINKIKINA